MGSFVYRYEIPDNQFYDVGNWHSPYFFLAFFEARKALFESLGVTQDMIKDAGLAIIVRSLHCDYFLPLTKGEGALIEIIPTKIGRSSTEFTYKVFKENDLEKICRAEGKTVQILIDRETRRPAALPDWIKNPLHDYNT